MDNHIKPVEKLKVTELWGEVERLNINAPANAKKASLQKLVRNARKLDTGSSTTVQTRATRGTKRKVVAHAPSSSDEDDDLPASTSRRNDEQNQRMNNLETSLIEVSSAVKALTEFHLKNTGQHSGHPHGGQHGFAQENGVDDNIRAPDAILDSERNGYMSKEGLDRGPILGLDKNPMTPPHIGVGLNQGKAPGFAYNPAPLSTPLDILHSSVWQRDREAYQTMHQTAALSYTRARHLLASQQKGIASHSLPKINMVTPHQCNEIISGRDFNLAKLLLPDSDDFTPKEILLTVGEAVPIQQKRDHRLTKLLPLSDFLQAFNIYYGVMIDHYPHRARELDQYRSNICQLEKDFGPSFYHYHKLFSAKASAALLNKGLLVDWSMIDYDLHLKVFAGRRANTCNICSGVDHTTDYCTLKRESGPRHAPKSSNKGSNSTKRVLLEDGVEVCDRHNYNNCFRGEGCIYHHVCLICFSNSHVKGECPRSTFRGQQRTQKPSATGGQRSDRSGKK